MENNKELLGYLKELETFKTNQLKELLNVKEQTEKQLVELDLYITSRNEGLKNLQGYMYGKNESVAEQENVEVVK